MVSGDSHIKQLTAKFFLFVSLSIILTTTAVAGSNQCEIESKSRLLSCKAYRQTTKYTCGPAAIMALMRYFGKINPKDMNKTTEMRISSELRATGDGSSPGQLESWLSSHGFSVSSGICVTSNMIKNNIDRGIPTIVAYERHWLLAKGYKKDSAGDVIIFADSICGTTTLSAETVDTMWSAGSLTQKNCSIHSGYYITARPS